MLGVARLVWICYHLTTHSLCSLPAPAPSTPPAHPACPAAPDKWSPTPDQASGEAMLSTRLARGPGRPGHEGTKARKGRGKAGLFPRTQCGGTAYLRDARGHGDDGSAAQEPGPGTVGEPPREGRRGTGGGALCQSPAPLANASTFTRSLSSLRSRGSRHLHS